jgi:hypothetical protein
MGSLHYNIPASMVESYRGRQLIVRSDSPAEIVGKLSTEDLENVSYIQVLSLHADLGPLTLWRSGIPVDLVVQDVESDLPLLYQCAPLLTRRAVRVTVPVVAGFSKVVKLALALNFAVKLDVSQPGPELIREMDRVLGAYLHQSTVSEPVEYFHSLFLAYYRGETSTLWSIQEEDPALVRNISEDGAEALPIRLSGHEISGDLLAFANHLKAERTAGETECSGCDFLAECDGYFKWPNGEYPCEGVKGIFQTLREAAEQFRSDVTCFHGGRGDASS